MSSTIPSPGVGTLVISLDFELHWGVRDQVRPGDRYWTNLMGARAAVPRLLQAFAARGIAATWATVGMVLARTRDEVERCSPAVRPVYDDRRLRPYDEPVGVDEASDPIHFGASLVEAVAATPRQEIASHTFSHYYCLEPGQDKEAFRADLQAAKSIARLRGLETSTIVLPRNQVRPGYADILLDAGFRCYRGNQAGFLYRSRRYSRRQTAPLRIGRLADAYVKLSRPSLWAWNDLVDQNGLCNVAESRYLRPWSPTRRAFEPLRLRRIVTALDQAAKMERIFHLWWHPHDFGTHLDENMSFLERVLDDFERLRQSAGMQSLAMGQVAKCAMAIREP